MKAKLFPLLLLFSVCCSVLAAENKSIIYITGQINRPGVIELKKGMTVWDAIEAAGGISRLGRSEFVIKRKGKEEPLVATLHYDFTELSKAKQAAKMKEIKLKPDDRIWLYDRETADSWRPNQAR
ncbi:MAG: SLBB domain-containing protein [Opitutaceae bacterium]